MTNGSSPSANVPPEERPLVQGKTVARNAALNLIGLGLPLAAAVVSVPYVMPRLGVDRFGILSLAWVLFSYLTIFDLGLGRAATKFVADCLGSGQRHRIAGLFWTTLTVQAVLGVLGAAVATLLLPVLVHRLLNIPAALQAETQHALLLLTWALPVAVATTTLRGALEANQRFDLVTWVRIPASSSLFLLPALGVALGFKMPGIIALMNAQFAVTAVAYGWLCLRLMPEVRRYQFQWSALRPVAVFGGWVTLSNLVAPILVSLDRFVVGARLPVASVAYYAVPFDLIMRLLIIPNSLASALFPAFSTLSAGGGGKELGHLYLRGVKVLMGLLGPILLLVAIFAHPLITLWLDAEFAANSAPVLQILTIGVLIGSLAFIPYVALQAIGRPDLPAKFHFLQLPPYIAILWLLTGAAGIAGAALACTIRMAADAGLLFVATYRPVWADERGRRAMWRITTLITAVALITWAVAYFRIYNGLFGTLALAPVALAAAVWMWVLDGEDRLALTAAATRFLGQRRKQVEQIRSGGANTFSR